LELLADNWLLDHRAVKARLDAIVERYPLTLHSVGMSLGGPEPIDLSYLQKLKRLIKNSQACWLSEHLCFNHVGTHYFPDLLPLAYTSDMIHRVVARIKQVQDYLEMPILVENVSSYVQYKDNEMTEGAFINTICQEAQCGLILDINNLYVSERNHGTSAIAAMQDIDIRHVVEIHLAGHADHGATFIDTHDRPISEPVWELFETYTQGNQITPPTLIEWDTNIPTIDVLLTQQQRAQHILSKIDRQKYDEALG